MHFELEYHTCTAVLQVPHMYCQMFPCVPQVEYIKGVGDTPGGDIFFFDYGVVACWGLTKSQEMTIVRGLARQCHVQPLPDKEVRGLRCPY